MSCKPSKNFFSKAAQQKNLGYGTQIVLGHVLLKFVQMVVLPRLSAK